MKYSASPSIAASCQALNQGRVIAYPTEAVWGLGCDPFDETAVNELLALKSRSVNKGLILISGHYDHFAPLLDGLEPKQLSQLSQTWPGPFTWLVPHRQLIPEWISGQYDTVAIRVSAHPYVKAITARFGGAIVSTSANPQGLPPARFAWQVQRYFGARNNVSSLPPFITQGQVGKQRQPSEVRNLLTGDLIRAGR